MVGRAAVVFSQRLCRAFIAAWIAGVDAFLQAEPTKPVNATGEEIAVEGGVSNGRV